MYGGYSYGNKHIEKVIPMNNQVIKIGNPPPHPTIFVGPVTVRELKKRMEVDAEKLEKQIHQRNYLSEINRNEINIASVNISQISEDKENISNETVTLIDSISSSTLHPPELDSFSSKNSSSSNHTYTLENSDQQSPSHDLNNTYDKLEVTETFCLQIDETHNVTSIRDRKSVADKSTFKNYRQTRQDSMASEALFNLNKTNDVSQSTDTSANLTATNKSVHITFTNLKLDDDCGNLTNMSMSAYKNSPVAKVLMDDKFSNDYSSPSKPKSARKSIRANAEKHNSPITPKSANRKSVSRPVTPKSTPGRKSVSKSKEASAPVTPRSSSALKSRKSLFTNEEETKPGTPNVSPVRKSISRTELKAVTATLRTSSMVKRKRSHLKEEELNMSPDIRKSLLLNKENISMRKTPGKMSTTSITELKAENCLINSSFCDSTESSENRSTPDVFRKIPNEMWKSKQNEMTEKPSMTPFKSKLPQPKKTPKKYDHIQSPISKYIHRGEGVQSMSKLRHSSCLHEMTAKSKSETKKKELSESKNKPCKIPQLRGNAHRKLDLPKINRSGTPSLNSSAIPRTSTIHN